MKDKQTDATLRFLVYRLRERALDALKESRDEPEDTFLAGRRMAYYEVLDILKTELSLRDADLKEVGLDTDLDRLFFGE